MPPVPERRGAWRRPRRRSRTGRVVCAAACALFGPLDAPAEPLPPTAAADAAPPCAAALPFVADPAIPYAHPFYWALFVILGNRL